MCFMFFLDKITFACYAVLEVVKDYDCTILIGPQIGNIAVPSWKIVILNSWTLEQVMVAARSRKVKIGTRLRTP